MSWLMINNESCLILQMWCIAVIPALFLPCIHCFLCLCSFASCTPSLDPFAFQTAVYFITKTFRSVFLGVVLENGGKRAGRSCRVWFQREVWCFPRSGWFISQEVIKHTNAASVNQRDWQHGPGEDPGGKIILPWSKILLFFSFQALCRAHYIFFSLFYRRRQSVYWKLHVVAALWCGCWCVLSLPPSSELRQEYVAAIDSSSLF